MAIRNGRSPDLEDCIIFMEEQNVKEHHWGSLGLATNGLCWTGQGKTKEETRQAAKARAMEHEYQSDGNDIQAR